VVAERVLDVAVAGVALVVLTKLRTMADDRGADGELLPDEDRLRRSDRSPIDVARRAGSRPAG
jgi:hypothetical protein